MSIVKKIDGKVDENNLIKFAKYLEITKDELVDIINSYANKSIFKFKGNEYIEIYERY